MAMGKIYLAAKSKKPAKTNARISVPIVTKRRKRRIGRMKNPVGLGYLRHSGNQIFPPTLRIKANMHKDDSTTASAAVVRSYKGNSFYAAGPANSYGAGFVGNVPSGLFYLLSSSNAAGAIAPYQQFRIHSSSIRVTFATNPPAIGGGSTIPIYVYIIPSVQSTLAGMSNSQLEEQPYCKRYIITTLMTKALTIKHSMLSTKIWGDAPESIYENEYSGTPAANPQNVWYWHIELRAANGSQAFDCYFDTKITYVADLHTTNQFLSTVPS